MGATNKARKSGPPTGRGRARRTPAASAPIASQVGFDVFDEWEEFTLGAERNPRTSFKLTREERRLDRAMARNLKAFRDPRHLYFAYGSNLDPKQMARRCPDAQRVGGALLEGWRLVFRGVADVAPAEGRSVYGGLWLVSDRDLLNLDRYEGVGAGVYRRVAVIVETDAGPAAAVTYTMARPRGLMLPAPDYFGRIVRGYRAFGLEPKGLDAPLYGASRALVKRGVRALVPDGKRMAPARGRSRTKGRATARKGGKGGRQAVRGK